MTSPTPYLVSPVPLAGNRESVLDLWHRMPELSNIPDSKFDWIYLQNPLQPATMYWARQGETPVGMIAVIPRRFQMQGKQVIAGAAADFGVVKEHRAFGPALALQRAATAEVNNGKMSFLYGIPTQKSIPVLNRIGYTRAGKVHWLTKPLRIEAIRPVPFVGGLVNAGLRLVSAETWRSTQPGFRLEEMEVFQDEVNLISEAMFRRHPCIASRTAAELNWRFAPGKGPRSYEKLGLHRQQELRAYVVGYRKDKRFHIADLAALTEHDIGQLLHLLIQRERSVGSVAVSTVFFGSSSLVNEFKRFGFLDRPNDSHLYIYATPEIAGLSKQIEDWYLFEGDTDM